MKKIFLILTALTIGAALTPQAVSAYKGDPTMKGPNCTEERRAAIEKAIEAKDYNAWKTLMTGRGRVTQVINEQNFAKFAQAFELAKQGKVAEANKIRAELGLGLRNGSGYRAHR